MAPGETSGRAGTTPADDPLKRLGERLEQASEAAERLMDEAAARFAGHPGPPPSGWQTQEQADAPAHLPTTDLVLMLQSLREFVPDDLQRRLAEAIRELLLAIRSLIDWQLERLEQRRAKPTEVQDIPVL
jgi:LmbE family N-acetylglucosaminyl deacetylase